MQRDELVIDCAVGRRRPLGRPLQRTRQAIGRAASDGVRGLFASSDILDGTLLLSVPTKLLLTAGIGLSRGWPSSIPEAT